MDNEADRNYGIDLLRMIAMFMVVILHILEHGGILSHVNFEEETLHYEIAWLLEIAAYCAVNCYAMISGYVSINLKFKYTRILMLWFRVAFYTILITTIFSVAVPGSVNLKECIKAIFPVMTEQYWYFSAYFCMFFLIPFMNAAIHTLTQNQLKHTIVALVMLSSVLDTFFRYNVCKTQGGYSLIWLIILYIIGAYIKKYNVFEKTNSFKALSGYLFCVLVTWIAKFVLEIATLRLLGEVKGGSIVVSYISPTILGAAICLLVVFKNIHITAVLKKVIGKVSSLAFSVYLIHQQPLIRDYLIKEHFASYASFSVPLMVLAVIGSACGIYIICSVIDLFREYIFEKLRVKENVTSVENRISIYK